MKKPILISIAIMVVLSVIFVISRGEPEALFSVLFLSFTLSIPGILISLIILIPAIRKRTQNNLIIRVITLLSVVILFIIIFSITTIPAHIKLQYVFAFVPPMTPGQYEDYPRDKIAEFEDKFEQHQEAIVHETWIRVMLPPFLREACYTNEKDICEFVDEFHGNKEIMSLNNYIEVTVFTLAHSLVGGVFAWHFTRRIHP